jgi:hypothetical protein
MPTIQLYPLWHNKVAIVDEGDFVEASMFHWTLNSCGYAIRHRPKSERGPRQIYMHRQLAKAREDEWVDHANHDILDNRRANLRLCDRSKNTCNSRLLKRNKLGVKGVCPRGRRFQARVFHQGQDVFRQCFDTVEEAKAAYDFHAKLHHGEFAKL